MTGLLRWLEKNIAILFRCLSLDAKLIAEPVRWGILFWASENRNCRFWCAGACSLCWGLPEKSWKFPPPIPPRYSHYFTSHTHPITLHSHPIPLHTHPIKAFPSPLATHWQSLSTDWHLVRWFCKLFHHSHFRQAVWTLPLQICLRMPSDLAIR